MILLNDIVLLLASNLIFTHTIGLSTLLLASKSRKELICTASVITVFTTIGSIAAYFVNQLLGSENQIFALIGAIIFGYFAVASLGTYMRKYEVAISMFPYDTNAMEALLLEETDKESAKELAQNILSLEKDNAQAYNTLAYAALMDGEYERALAYKLEVLKREKYNMDQYADFVSMVETIQSVPQVEKAFCEKKIQEMQALLAQTKEQTSEIAYYLRDKPEFVIPNVSEE